jgi:type IV pilus assembly protein PilA
VSFPSGNERGFTLIELMVVVAIVGVLAALAVYGVRRYLSHSKTTEARNAVGQVAKDAKSAFERESMLGGVLPAGAATAVVNDLCLDAASSVPDNIAKVTGQKYQSAGTDWTNGNSSTTGFVCLRFSISDPQYYLYDYKGSAGPAGTFTAISHGDLDGNGVLSTISLAGRVAQGIVLVSPNFIEVSPEE